MASETSILLDELSAHKTEGCGKNPEIVFPNRLSEFRLDQVVYYGDCNYFDLRDSVSSVLLFEQTAGM
jgi:hypothetical protein